MSANPKNSLTNLNSCFIYVKSGFELYTIEFRNAKDVNGECLAFDISLEDENDE